MIQTSDPLCFGDIGAWWNHDFRGGLDNIRLWNVERTQSQIATTAMTVFTTTQAQAASGLIGSWSFDGGTVTDAKGQNNGVLNRGATIATDNTVYSNADCNADGVLDAYQVAIGQLPDADNNGIPDGVAIVTQPTDQNVGVDTPVAFVVEVGTDPACTTPVTYQWQRRNPLVADPASPNAWIDLADGNGFFGTHAPNLTLLRPIPGLATGYRCKIGGGCGCEPSQGGFVYTNTVNFSVACPADFNADGGIDFGDVEAFFERWENGC